LGFTLERYDAVGRLRDLDHGKPVDDSGSYRTRTGRTVAISGARGLAEMLAGSAETQAAFTEQLFHHLVQQPGRAYGANTLEDLRKSFVKNDLSIRKLAVEIMTASALVGRDS
jgi:hypothetical protein